MTRDETARIVAAVRLLWPHSNLGGSANEIVTTWHHLLDAFPVETVEKAVRELAAQGREHAPPPGVVVKTCAERVTDLPDWDQAWQEIDRLVRRRGQARPPQPEHFSHPLIGQFAIPAWRELCQGPAPGTKDFGTHYAQQREAFKGLRARQQRDTGLAAIGAPRRNALTGAGDVFAHAGRPELGQGKAA